MNKFQKYGLIFLSVTLLLPSTISLSHIFAHENEIVCNDYSDSHFHETKPDCELCKLHIAPFPNFQLSNFNLYLPLVAGKKYFSNYKFLSDYQKLSFELRGPPPALLPV